jgi:hypothetical protein
MSKILKNGSGSDVTVSDTGVTVVDGGQYTIQPQDYNLWAASDDVITEVGAGNLVVNDGSVDLGISDGIDLIKGIFQKSRIIGDTDDTLIGNVGDSLKVAGGGEDGEFEVKPSQSHQVDFNKIVCLLDEMIRQMRILNTHMASVTDLEDLEEEPGDHPIV